MEPLSYGAGETPFDWDELLLFIAEQRVVPILGRELLQIEAPPGEQALETHLARRLAGILGVDEYSAEPTLDEVATLYVQAGGPRRKVYSKLKTLYQAEPPPVPRALRQLAEITDFRLFVSTTWDDLLAQAVDAARFAGEPRARRAAFSPHLQAEDLLCEVRQLPEPVVYQIFGRLSASADYAVTDEDVLEFLHVLQSESARPPILFDELRGHHLLFIGCGFPGWLARFFVRTITNQRLLIPRETSQIVADAAAGDDPALARFLRLYDAELFFPGSPRDFVEELHRRWNERHQAAAEADDRAERAPDMPPGAVFLSYAREDLESALLVARALREAGLEVWFDQARLATGDAWDLEIRKNVRRCSLFLPLLSKNAQRRVEGYFRKEWRWAIDRAQGFDESFPFILPVVVDDLPAGADGVPEEFWSRQCEMLEERRVRPEFVERTLRIVRELRLREAGYS